MLQNDMYRIDEDDAAQCFLPRPADSHKGDYGYVALAGGSFRYSGAIRLAGMAQKSVRDGMEDAQTSAGDEITIDSSDQKAGSGSDEYVPRLAGLAQSAVSAGAGVVMLAVPRSLCYAIRPEILESTLYPLSDVDGELVFVPEEWDELIRRCRVIAIGMGIGNTKETAAAVKYLLENYTGRLLIDADGLNALAGMRIADVCVDKAEKPECAEILRGANCDIVLTPHPGEMARLCGCTTGEVLADPAGIAQAFAAKSGATVLLKGASTVVSDGTHTYMSDRGCAGMATGGSGDVLSGVLAAMLGYWNPERMPLGKLAACGAWTAGLAGELAQQESCDIAMKASDTARHVRDAVTYLRKKHG